MTPLTPRFRLALAVGALLASSALIPRAASAAPSLTSAWTATPPVIDGTIAANEWTSAAIPLEFRWPGMIAYGRLWTQWRGDRLYIAATIDQGAVANELDVAIDANGDGRLQTGEPAYLAWASGFTQQFSYDAARRGFIQDPRGTSRAFWSASAVQGSSRTFEYAIAANSAVPMRLALKLERGGKAGQFDTWPTNGSRDPITRNPHEWAYLLFAPVATPTITPPALPVAPTPDRTPPQILLAPSPVSPTAQESIIWRASAWDTSGITSIELFVNGTRIRACAAALCEERTGPYAAGMTIGAEARAYDGYGNVAIATQTITVQLTPGSAAGLGIPAQYTGSGSSTDRFSSASAARNNGLFLGTGAVGNVAGTAFTFAPSRADAISLAWAGIRHGLNPNYLAALAIQESKYQCLQHLGGCFGIEAPTFAELAQQFPSLFQGTAYESSTRNLYLAPQIAAFRLRFIESLFRRWYDWDSFVANARDGLARLKLLSRAYDRGVWEATIGTIVKTNRQQCIATNDLFTCYESNDAVRDYMQAAVAYTNALMNGTGYDGEVVWTDIETLLREAVYPLVPTVSREGVTQGIRARYDALMRDERQFTFSRELPRLLAWLAVYLPPLESPQQLQWYTAPI